MRIVIVSSYMAIFVDLEFELTKEAHLKKYSVIWKSKTQATPPGHYWQPSPWHLLYRQLLPGPHLLGLGPPYRGSERWCWWCCWSWCWWQYACCLYIARLGDAKGEGRFALHPLAFLPVLPRAILLLTKSRSSPVASRRQIYSQKVVLGVCTVESFPMEEL